MKIEQMIETLISEALNKRGIALVPFEIEIPNDRTHGDFSSNIAMKLARVFKKPPLAIANELIEAFPINKELFINIEAANPGFINFYVNPNYYTKIIYDINTLKEQYGSLNIGALERINIEFVSANPTGSLHIGHARGAAAGDSLARILTKAGYQVTREFYVNDGGNQIHNLVLSIDARYKQAFGMIAELPEDGYYGKEIIEIAQKLMLEQGDYFLENEDAYDYFREYGVKYLLQKLEDDLKLFNVHFDVWFSETSLYKTNEVETTLAFLKSEGHAYTHEGAIWLKTTMYGDEKDRVIVKSDGSYTYLLPDIAYHKNKLSRGYTKLINILGGDHHGYVPRLQAAIQMIGGKEDSLAVDLLQMVKVIQNNEEVKMSKRSGKAITLADLIDEVGSDPIRYFFAMRSLNTHMDLDLDLAIKESNENPVYYAQYAHARTSSILRLAESKGIVVDLNLQDFKTLHGEKTHEILAILADYPRVIKEAAQKRMPHRVPQFINRLAQAFHSFYAVETVITEHELETMERLALIHSVKTVLKDALSLIGVSAKEKM